MIVPGGSDGNAKQILIIVDGLDDRAQEQQELPVLGGSGAGFQKVDARVGRDGPVVMLAAAVDAREGFFMQQADHSVTLGDLLHQLHRQLVVVGRKVRRGEDGGKFVLRGSDFVVLRLGKHTQLPKLFVQLFHKGLNAGLDDTEIMIVQLLTLRRLAAVERAAGVDQILALVVNVLINKEVFLLGTDRCADVLAGVVAEEAKDTHGLTVDRLHRAKKRCLFVKRFAAVGTERGGDAKHAVFDERVARGIPCGVAAGFERGAKAAGGEARGVGLALDQLLAGELHDDFAVFGRRNEGVVLFGGDAGHRLEPVSEMGCALFNGPVLHGIGDDGGDVAVHATAILDRLLKLTIRLLGKASLHHFVVKNHGTENFRYVLHL